MTSHPCGTTLLVRAVDAGDTYISFRWLDEPQKPIVHRIPGAQLRLVLARLDTALISGEDEEAAVKRALNGPFTDHAAERELSRNLAQTVVPADVCARLRQCAASGSIVTVRITPSPALARIPFELLVVGDPASAEADRRLIELAEIVYEPPATVHVGRSRLPKTWSAEFLHRPAIFLIDPDLPDGCGLDQVLPRPKKTQDAYLPTNIGEFEARIATVTSTARSGVHKVVGRWDLSDELNANPGRLFYFGHVSSTFDQPGSASVHLTDPHHEWGLAQIYNNAHRPLSALDLLLGTRFDHLGPSGISPVEPDRLGHELWPMPPRVAIIACEGGADYRSAETFGLVIALFNAGAELVTTTRWTLPSDGAFESVRGFTEVPGPTTALALAVDETHTSPDPVAGLTRWQRGQLTGWRDTGDLRYSPLIWAAANNHLCPARPVTRIPADR